jgi:hypothetical protein
MLALFVTATIAFVGVVLGVLENDIVGDGVGVIDRDGNGVLLKDVVGDGDGNIVLQLTTSFI